MKTRSTAFVLIGLHVLLGFYAIADVLSKTASSQTWLSWPFILCYAGILAILFVYAIAWQQIIKRMPLTSAYANRAVTIVWGIFWGVLLFGESLTVGKIAGAVLIMAGIVLFAFADRQETQAAPVPADMDGEGDDE